MRILSRTRHVLRVLRLAAAICGVSLLLPALVHAGSSAKSSAPAWGSITASDGLSFSWGLIDPRTGSTISDGEGWGEVNGALHEEQGPVFWFRVDDRNFVVRDPEMVARATGLSEPVRELGRRQGQLGARQAELGDQQARLGERQARLGERQERLSEASARLSLGVSGNDRREGELERRKLEAAMRDLEREMRELEASQRPLSRMQADLGAQQSDLGREQARISEAVGRKMRELAEEAMRARKALPLLRHRSI